MAHAIPDDFRCDMNPDARDNVVTAHIQAPNLDMNQRAADDARSKKSPSLTKDLNYNVNDASIKARIHTAIISAKPFNPLQNE
jgi:hypothetical protein